MDVPPFPPSALSSPHSRRCYYAAPSCDRAPDDHHIGADSNASTTTPSDTPTTTPSVRSTHTGSFYHTRSIHGAVPIDMTPQDEDALFNPDHGGGGQSISAFAAVSHYPYVEPGESERLAVDDVVNVHAVVDRGGYMYEFGERGGRRQGAGDTEGYTITEGAGRRPWTVEGDEDIDVDMSSLSFPDYDDEDGDGDEDEDDPDDTRKFYPDAVLRRDREWPGGGVSLAGVPDFDYGGFHWGGAEVENDGNDEDLGYDYDSTSQSEGIPVSQETLDSLQDNSTGAVDAISISGEPNGPMFGIAIEDFPVTTYERNFTVDQFVDQWIYQSNPQTRNNQLFVPPYRTSTILSVDRPEKIVRPSGGDGLDFFDLQQIPWWDRLRAKRTDARIQRDLWYRPYHNVDHAPHETAKLIHRPEFYFREKAMYMKHRASIEHFQLRNLMSAPAYNTVHFACESRLLSWVPGYDDFTCLIDLSRPPKDTVLEGPTKISTMKTGLGVSIVGGFAGEYAIRADTLSNSTGPGPGTPNTAGYVTRDLNGITNHIDIISHRTAHSPTAIFASNDNHLRVLDCETDTFTSDVDLSRAVNCTSTSPDGRLRVIVGDSPEALILEADTGRPVRPLHAHRDFGFACAWSPDMWHIATANQDKTTIIWDARMWRPLTMLAADVAGYRSLKFSPVGSGERSLLMVEPADRIVLVNASTYESRQVHDFFGEIAGADFSPDGAGVWVANADDNYGGFMEFEQRGWGSKFSPGAGAGACGFVNEWAGDDGLSDDERCVVGNKREREFRFLRNWSDEEYETLLL